MKCWYCLVGLMKEAKDLRKGWYRCSSCGATWVKVPILGPSPISIEYDEVTGGTKYKARRVTKGKKAKK